MSTAPLLIRMEKKKKQKKTNKTTTKPQTTKNHHKTPNTLNFSIVNISLKKYPITQNEDSSIVEYLQKSITTC